MIIQLANSAVGFTSDGEVPDALRGDREYSSSRAAYILILIKRNPKFDRADILRKSLMRFV